MDDQKTEENAIFNKKIAKESSWLNSLFQEHKMSCYEKREVMRRLGKELKKK